MAADYEKPIPLPRKLPKQGRSKVLVDAIVEACENILARGDAEQLTTNYIAEVAGVNIGSLYQYFPNKEAVLATVFTRKMAAERAEFADQSNKRILAQSALSLSAALAEVIRVKAELHERFLALHGDFYRDYYDFFDFEETVNEYVSTDLQQPTWSVWVRSLLKHYQHELRIDDIDRAAFLVANIIGGLLSAAVREQPVFLSEDSFLSQVHTAALNAISQ
jgi:AcrR family transcriptional regulator